MTLLEELIEGASGRDVDLPTLLRRLKMLAVRLGSKPAEDWIGWELDGYPSAVSVPAYRERPMQLQGDFLGGVHRAENFIIPPGLVPEEIRGKMPVDRIRMRQSVSFDRTSTRRQGRSGDGADGQPSRPLKFADWYDKVVSLIGNYSEILGPPRHGPKRDP